MADRRPSSTNVVGEPARPACGELRVKAFRLDGFFAFLGGGGNNCSPAFVGLSEGMVDNESHKAHWGLLHAHDVQDLSRKHQLLSWRPSVRAVEDLASVIRKFHHLSPTSLPIYPWSRRVQYDPESICISGCDGPVVIDD